MFRRYLLAAFVLASVAGLTFYANPIYCQAITEGLISYWSFDRSDIEDDTVMDVWGDQNATMMGKPEIVEGKVGEALKFTGADYLLVTDDIVAAKLPVEEMTAEVWVSPDHFIEWGGYIGAFQDNGGFEKGWILGTNNQISFAISTEGADDGDGILTYLKAAAFDVGNWYHIAATYDGIDTMIYVNGNLEGTSVVQSGAINYPDKIFLTMGVYKDDNEHFPHMGMLDEVRLYDRALDEDEVFHNYSATGISVDYAGNLSVTWGKIKRQT